MGHVPSSPFSFQRESLDLPRRQYRRSRPAGNPDLARRPSLGYLGESLAAELLDRHGITIVGRNLTIGIGEVDLVALDGTQRLIVEVRTTTGSIYPLDAVGTTKRAQVRRLAAIMRVRRIDTVGIGIFSDHFVAHWESYSF